jgi:membrane-associated phospholipid phosphatase
MTLPDWLRELDEQAFLYVNGGLHGLHWKRLEGFLVFFNLLGNAMCLAPIVVVVTVLAPTFRAWLRRFAELVLPQAGVFAAVQGLKAWAARARPPEALAGAFADGRAFHAFGEAGSRGSFPSGHATTVFAMATVLAWWAGRLPPGWRRVVGRALPFASASLTLVARVYAGSHFPLDVLAGAVLGTALALVVLLGVRAVLGPDRPAPLGLSPSGPRASPSRGPAGGGTPG